ncbi:MAG: acyl-CoA thioesterase [Ignavibacteria bacterium]
MNERSAFRFAITLPVRFGDLDVLGHVNNATYLTYFEEARIAYWRNLFTLDGEKMESLGIILADANVNFRSPAKLGELLKVSVRVAAFGTKSFRMEYKIENASTQRLIADGSTAVVMFDYRTGTSIPVPDEVKKTILAFESP